MSALRALLVAVAVIGCQPAKSPDERYEACMAEDPAGVPELTRAQLCCMRGCAPRYCLCEH
jgi:hypothetical protein